MPANRRDFVKFAGGAAVGVAASPVPWKLLDDTAIWTQNWESIPKLARGPVETRTTRCTLCPAGCPVTASLVSGVPIRLSGRLCPSGIAAHELPWHPFRLREVHIDGRRSDADTARKQIAAAIGSATKPVAVLDGRPGRTASRMYRQAIAALPNAVYVTPELADLGGVDPERVETVVGFGAPVLEGAVAWASGKRVMQVDARHSRTASLAERWFVVKPGTEGLVAVAIANRLGQKASTDQIAGEAGLEPRDIDELVEIFATGKAYAVGSNARMLNALAAPGLITQRRPVPDIDVRDVRSMRMADVAPESLGVLIVDGTTLDADVSARGLRSMVARDGLLVVLSAYASDLVEKAGVAIPAPAPFESWDDLPVASYGKAATYAVAQPLLPAKGVVPADFVAQVAGLNTELAKEIEARAATIHASRRGTIEKPVREMEAKQVWEALSTGATWMDEPAPAQKALAVAEVESARWTPQADFPLALIPYRTTESPLHNAQPPILTKIYQESGLRPVGGTVRVHPETAAANRLEESREAILRTRTGECRVIVRLDRLVQRGVLEAPLSPSRAELSGTARPSTPALLDLTAGAAVTAARMERV